MLLLLVLLTFALTKIIIFFTLNKLIFSTKCWITFLSCFILLSCRDWTLTMQEIVITIWCKFRISFFLDKKGFGGNNRENYLFVCFLISKFCKWVFVLHVWIFNIFVGQWHCTFNKQEQYQQLCLPTLIPSQDSITFQSIILSFINTISFYRSNKNLTHLKRM